MERTEFLQLISKRIIAYHAKRKKKKLDLMAKKLRERIAKEAEKHVKKNKLFDLLAKKPNAGID